jgi:hypothetical protein
MLPRFDTAILSFQLDPQGRLPLNHKPITLALEKALDECLSSLQVTNTSILLSRMKLRSIVRDLRYIPKLAFEIALCVGISTNPEFRERGQRILEQEKNGSHTSVMDSEDENEASSSSGSPSTDDGEIDTFRLSDELKHRLLSRVQAKMRAFMISKKRRQTKNENNDEDDLEDLDGDYDDPDGGSKSKVEENHKIHRTQTAKVDDNYSSDIDVPIPPQKPSLSCPKASPEENIQFDELNDHQDQDDFEEAWW